MRSRPVELLKNWCLAFFDPRRLGRVFELPRFVRDYHAFKAQAPSAPVHFIDNENWQGLEPTRGSPVTES